MELPSSNINNTLISEFVRKGNKSAFTKGRDAIVLIQLFKFIERRTKDGEIFTHDDISISLHPDYHRVRTTTKKYIREKYDKDVLPTKKEIKRKEAEERRYFR